LAFSPKGQQHAQIAVQLMALRMQNHCQAHLPAAVGQVEWLEKKRVEFRGKENSMFASNQNTLAVILNIT